MMAPTNQRLGFHYFADTNHYREIDLQAWLPELHRLGAAWLTLIAPAGWAVPEYFITGLLADGLQPILHFPLTLEETPDYQGIGLMLRNYARWGVRYAAFYDRPNRQNAWLASGWAQTDLVERFLDAYLPLAQTALEQGIVPLLPPLEPGGDYWDLAFLQLTLRGLHRRNLQPLLDELVMGAYAWAGNRPLGWGEGGPGRWPGVRPYQDAPGMQNQQGFRIFDWYLAIAEQELGRTLPIVLLRAGVCPGDQTDPGLPVIDEAAHAQGSLAIARCLAAEADLPDCQEPVPGEVLACNLWLLADEPDGPHARQAWFQVGGRTLPAVDALRRWAGETGWANGQMGKRSAPAGGPAHRAENSSQAEGADLQRPISHYVLLPLYAWGAAEWSLDLIAPLLQTSRATVGFSSEEARMAERVTVVGGDMAISEVVVAELRQAGCVVDRILEDGTVVAP
ncbi:MAG: hypothetical protein JXB15_04920 [Anaerolineales bacterium]|nr:hypothetical protein [Anaerolineales bacterium]